MKQCLLHIEPLGVTLSVDRGISLYEVLKNCHLEFPCRGKGLCGNCKVRILSGQVEKTEVHRAFLERKHLSSEWCLACLMVLTEDLTIEIPEGRWTYKRMSLRLQETAGKRNMPLLWMSDPQRSFPCWWRCIWERYLQPAAESILRQPTEQISYPVLPLRCRISIRPLFCVICCVKRSENR